MSSSSKRPPPIVPFRCWILDDDNRPIEVDVVTWGKWYFTFGNRVVAYTQITSAIEVSTIFIGIDHRHTGKGPPILFESMVLGGRLHEECKRYASWDDAQVGHRILVKRCRKAIGQRVTEESDNGR